MTMTTRIVEVSPGNWRAEARVFSRTEKCGWFGLKRRNVYVWEPIWWIADNPFARAVVFHLPPSDEGTRAAAEEMQAAYLLTWPQAR